MYEHTLFIGLFDKDTHEQVLSTSEFKQIISNTLGDCTIKEGQTGYYTHDNGSKVTEPSLEVKKFGGSKRDIVNKARILKVKLNQESIILDTKRSNSTFI